MHVFRRPPDYAVKHSASLSPAQLKLANVWRAPWVNKGPGFLVDDIVMTQRTDFSVSGDPVTVYRAHGEVVSVGIDAVTGDEYADILVEEGAEYFDANEDLEWVAVGNKSTPERAAIIYMTADEVYAPRIEMRSGVDSWSKFGSMESLRVAIGNLSGIVDSNFGSLSGYGIFTDNAYFKGGIALGSATALSSGTGLWASKEGDFRVGDISANKFLRFTQSTGVFDFGSAVAFQWSSVSGAGKPADNATVGANWASNLAGIPIRFAEAPSGAGLYVTASYMGYYNASTWTVYIQSNGQWYFGGDASNYIAWDGATLTVKGTITVVGGNAAKTDLSNVAGTGGTIAGMSISSTSLTAASGGNTTIVSSGATAFAAGPTGSPTFTVSQAGVLTATGVTISGAITATSGSFSGSISSTSGSIAGFTLASSQLSAASGGNTTIVSSGATAFAAGPTGAPTFSVTQAGVLTATGVAISGAITATSGSFSGTISGSTITASTFKTATSGTRLEIATSGSMTFVYSTYSEATISPYNEPGAGSSTGLSISPYVRIGDIFLDGTGGGTVTVNGSAVWLHSNGYVASAFGTKTAFTPDAMYVWDNSLAGNVQVYKRSLTINSVTVNVLVLD